ncbi:MAG: hypothetical protein SGI98_08035 [Verrucomicrobiota bacterium]|nr:hypothetical protein [Verrucomicrobiota bacterium]
MKQKPQEPSKDLGKDLKKFERLPVKTKELLILEDQAEKSTGPEKIDLDKKVRDKSK